MKAIHIYWSRPFFPDPSKFIINDFNLLVTMVSALEWRKHNGSIKLYADKTVSNYYKNIGIDSIYDGGIDDNLDKYIPSTLNPYMFWAAAKLYALRMEKAPIVMIDMDFVVWNNISDILKNNSLVVSHKELLHIEAYKSKNDFYMSPDYQLNESFDWSQLPCNTAFTYMGDNEFKDYYVNEAIRFMEINSSIPKEHQHHNIYMVFAEQRILSMCAKKLNIRPFCLFSNTNPSGFAQNFTHTWGMKGAISNHPDTNLEGCTNAIKYIVESYPEYMDVLKRAGRFDRYIENYLRENHSQK